MFLKYYLRFLSLVYFVGFILHVADILDLRLKFSNMDTGWKIWIAYLCIADLIASIGLWKHKTWGVVSFFVIAISQLIAYLGFIEKFGRQDFLVGFHILTLAAYLLIRFRKN